MKNIVESISIVIPAYQESTAIGDVVAAVLHVVAPLDYAYEIIVVDDDGNVLKDFLISARQEIKVRLPKSEKKQRVRFIVDSA